MKRILYVVVGIILGLGIGVGATTLFNAQDIAYSNSKTTATNVNEALDELYNEYSKCPDGFKCIKKGNTQILLDDPDNDGIADVGEEIIIGTEHFYVISNSNNKISALAKYGLNVGGEMSKTGVITAYSNYTNKQDSTLSTKNYTEFPIGGLVQFSTSSSSFSYSGSIVEGYVNNYVDILNNENEGLNVSGRLITYSELNALGGHYGNDQFSLPTWVYSSSYWTSTSVVSQDSTYLYYVSYNACIAYSKATGYESVRPVIEFTL